MQPEKLIAKLEDDFLEFFCYSFLNSYKVRPNLGHHHIKIAEVLNKAVRGEITRLIINIPPQYGKTTMAVHNFIAYCFAINPLCEFIHSSYSSDLALTNSEYIKDIIKSDFYQVFWPRKIKPKTDSKKKWLLEEGGGLYAVSSGGQVVGFGAGRLQPGGFNGGLIIDDPIKPSDAYSETLRDKINGRYDNTFASRVRREETLVVLIGQRVHVHDMSGFLLDRDAQDWYHLVLPAILPNGDSLWPFKYSVDFLKKKQKNDSFVFNAQYQQAPLAQGGNFFKDEYWRYYKVPPVFKYRFITVDTAQKAKEHNDYTVMQCWGVTDENRLFLIDLIRAKWEAPELERGVIAFVNKHIGTGHETKSKLRHVYVEDKVSGTTVIQNLRRYSSFPVKAIPRSKSKTERAHDIIGYIESGYVYLPEQAAFLSDFLDECRAFSTTGGDHPHDDQIDCMMDAIDIAFTRKNKGAWTYRG